MQINIPFLLRIKPGALDRIGKYVADVRGGQIGIMWGEGVKELFGTRVSDSLTKFGAEVVFEKVVKEIDIQSIFDTGLEVPSKMNCILAIGGGKVIDYSKYLAFISKKTLISMPTIISNDGFCSSLSSLYVKDQRKSVSTKIPEAVIIDTEVIQAAPRRFLYSGLGDLICKQTSIHDWKLAFHNQGEPVNDFAVAIAQNAWDLLYHYNNKDLGDKGFIRVIASSLVMAGIAMEIAGSSRPASGSEHLISHAYDRVAERPSLHGLQVGVASYVISHLQGYAKTMGALIRESGFLAFMSQSDNCLVQKDFIEAIKVAPSIKENFYTVLSEEGAEEKLISFIETDEYARMMIKP